MTDRQRIGAALLLFGLAALVWSAVGSNPLAPAPIGINGLAVLLIEDTGSADQLTQEQNNIGESVRLQRAIRDAGGVFFAHDVSDPGENVDAAWIAAVEKAQSLPGFRTPWLVVSNGRTGSSKPLPPNVDGTIAEVRKHTGAAR